MPKLLKKALADVLPQDYLASLVSSFDIVGDIAILKLPSSFANHGKTIAEIVLQRLHHVKTVLNQEGSIQGEYRLRNLRWLAGEQRMDTIAREAGCLFKVDLAKVYFSPRLSFEHMRICRLVRQGEVIINMFAGVGSFSILAAKHSAPSIVYSIDISPDATRFMRENVILNKVDGIVQVLEGDAREVVKTKLRSVADRVIMPLPEKALQYLETAIIALKPSGGMIHYYDFVHCMKKRNACGDVRNRVEGTLSRTTKEYSIMFSRVVRSVGPNWYQVVLDIHAVPAYNS
ncbi:MAG: class I SAM-dependent methyltransferase family protein [Candidatus Bathyarchaeia archaeon]